MERTNKGKAVKRYLSDYCIVDLETTSKNPKWAKIVEIAIIRVRGNSVVGEFSSLINPGCHIPASATLINHIDDEIVKKSPDLDSVIDEFMEFVGNDVIVGYNNAAYEMNVIYDALMDYRGVPFSNDYIDVLHMSKRCLKALDNYELGTVCKYFSIDTKGMHRALKDCYLTKECYDRLSTEYGDDAFGKATVDKNYAGNPSYKTLMLRELHSLLEQLIKRDTITIDDIAELRKWIEVHDNLKGEYVFDKVSNTTEMVLDDNKIAYKGINRIKNIITELVDPVKYKSFHGKIGPFEGTHICITGDFSYGSRSSVQKLIERVGGIFESKWKKGKIDYLIVGDQGSTRWKGGNYGDKIISAIEGMDKGEDIKIIEEDYFISTALNLSDNKMIKDTNHSQGISVENDWQTSVRRMLDEVMEEYELPEGSLYLSDNYGQTGKTKGKLISHSVCIWEPKYPKVRNEKQGQNRIVATIFLSTVKSRPDSMDINIREMQEGDLRAFLPLDAQIMERTKSDIDAGMVRIRIKNTSENLVDYLRHNTVYCLNGYVSKASHFGCCSYFEKCSDARKCIHENKLYSTACMYRGNLEQGIIYYGKNRNVQ